MRRITFSFILIVSIMNVQSIKDSADKIWKLLHGENRKWEYQEIKEACKLSDRELNAAMGWLASEGKIQFESTRIGDQEILYVELNFYIG